MFSLMIYGLIVQSFLSLKNTQFLSGWDFKNWMLPGICCFADCSLINTNQILPIFVDFLNRDVNCGDMGVAPYKKTHTFSELIDWLIVFMEYLLSY